MHKGHTNWGIQRIYLVNISWTFERVDLSSRVRETIHIFLHQLFESKFQCGVRYIWIIYQLKFDTKIKRVRFNGLEICNVVSFISYLELKFFFILKLFKNVNIMKTQLFHKMKYDLRGHPRPLLGQNHSSIFVYGPILILKICSIC